MIPGHLRYIVLGQLATFLILSAPVSAFACEPCQSSIYLEKNVHMADVIVIGKRFAPPLFDDNNNANGPAVIEVEVDEVLKGQLTHTIIKTKSWSGMCAYGVILYRERALLLLRKGPGYFSVVNPVCGGSQYIIINDQLTTKSRRGNKTVYIPLMSMSAFKHKYLSRNSDIPEAE